MLQSEKNVLGSFKGSIDIRGSLISNFGNLPTGINELSHHGCPIDNLSIVLYVERSGDLGH